MLFGTLGCIIYVRKVALLEMSAFPSSSSQIDLETRVPIHMPGAAKRWTGLENFLHRFLGGDLSHIVTSFRIGPLHGKRSVRECESMHIDATFGDYYEWLESKACLNELSPFFKLPKFSDNEIFIYADYKHFIELFKVEEECPAFGCWESIGMPKIASSQCTLWMGSRGCHTVNTKRKHLIYEPVILRFNLVSK